MKTFTIRMAELEDLDALTKIFESYRKFYEKEPNFEKAKEFLRDKFIHRESILYLAIDSTSEEILGFTQVYPTFSSLSMQRSLILNDLYVYEKYRKSGIATALLNQIKEYAILTDAKGIELSTAIDNTNAQRLYESLQYKKDLEFFHYYLSVS